MECRLIFDPPADGAWNMALDEALRASASGAGQGGCLRFYAWRVPTLSLGYFQPHAQRQTHRASHDCPLVRRVTGGGAIVHDHELTYSFTVPSRRDVRSSSTALYQAFHDGLTDELARYGIAARLCRPRGRRDEPEPFLCFQRRAERDVVLADAKIAGSAQRRHHDTLLQHGSILLRQSAAAPELPGIQELAAVDIDPRELAEGWARRMADSLGLTLRPATPTDDELQAAERFHRIQFGDPRWNERR